MDFDIELLSRLDIDIARGSRVSAETVQGEILFLVKCEHKMEKSLFYIAVENVINNWSALQLAVEHGMGGTEGSTKKTWLIGAIEQYFLENNGLDIDEVEDFLNDFLNDEFETIADDGSTSQIATKCCRFYELFRQNKNDELQALLPALPILQTPKNQAAHNLHQEPDTARCTQTDAAPSNSHSSNGTANEVEDMDTGSPNAEDTGWQTVTRSRRH